MELGVSSNVLVGGSLYCKQPLLPCRLILAITYGRAQKLLYSRGSRQCGAAVDGIAIKDAHANEAAMLKWVCDLKAAVGGSF